MELTQATLTPTQGIMQSTPTTVNTQNASGGRKSLSPGQLKLRRGNHKRQTVAAFIETMLGVSLPYSTDEVFRASIADGVVLCQLLNVLQPGSIPHVEIGAATPTSGVRQTFENVANFLDAAKQFTTELFSAADLEEPGERPQVVECLLSLQDWHQASPTGGGAAGNSTNGNAITPLSSYRRSLTTTPEPEAQHASHNTFSFTPQATELVQQHGPGIAAPDGLNYLMQSCTHMLKTRMGVPATPLPTQHTQPTHPDIALDAVGPILETVLSNLTSEYERRLLAKDQDHKLQLDAVEGLRRQVAALQGEVDHWRSAAESEALEMNLKASEQADALKAQERAEYERLLETEASLMCELAAKRRELEEVQAEASRYAGAADRELAALRSELKQYTGMQERYKKMQEENNILYNTVQDLRGSIRVFCRVRPRGATGDESSPVIELGEEGAVAVYSHKHNKWHEYKFDRVFAEDSSQAQVYQETKPLVRSVLDGYNVCIFAYGQTGSGKTHTMSGVDDTAAGVNFCALNDLFEQRDERRGEVNYTIKVQLLEVYNESVRDLLVHESEAKHPRSLMLVATKASGSNVPEATQIEVSSAEEVEAVMERGARNRAVAETRMNERSSRSHQVLTVMVEGVVTATHARTFGCLHLIDLAGSERVARSGAQGQQLIEAQHINKSLSALGCVMQALAQKREHIPFRDSKLTQLLQDSLGNSAKSMMFMHVAPEANSSLETLSTLNFGRGVTEITLGAATKNAESGALWDLREKLTAARREAEEERRRRESLEHEVASLRAQLEEDTSIPAFRPQQEHGAPSLPAVDAPRSGGSSATSNGLARPPQVARLNLSKLGTPQRDTPPPPPPPTLSSPALPPLSARGSKIPTPMSSSSSYGRSGGGSLTARPSLGGTRSSGNGSPAAGNVSDSLVGSGYRRPLTSRGSGSSSPSDIHSSLAATAAQSMLPLPKSRLSGGSGGSQTPRFGRVAAPTSARRWQ